VRSSSEATPYPRELPASIDPDTPVPAAYRRKSRRAITAVYSRSSDRPHPRCASRAAVRSFLAGPASSDAGDFGMRGMRKEVR